MTLCNPCAQLLASLCGLLCWLLLSLSASLLLLVLDALLLCYASDRDACVCSQPQVHAAYDQLAGEWGAGGVGEVLWGSLHVRGLAQGGWAHTVTELLSRVCICTQERGRMG